MTLRSSGINTHGHSMLSGWLILNVEYPYGEGNSGHPSKRSNVILKINGFANQ